MSRVVPRKVTTAPIALEDFFRRSISLSREKGPFCMRMFAEGLCPPPENGGMRATSSPSLTIASPLANSLFTAMRILLPEIIPDSAGYPRDTASSSSETVPGPASIWSSSRPALSFKRAKSFTVIMRNNSPEGPESQGSLFFPRTPPKPCNPKMIMSYLTKVEMSYSQVQCSAVRGGHCGEKGHYHYEQAGSKKASHHPSGNRPEDHPGRGRDYYRP